MALKKLIFGFPYLEVRNKEISFILSSVEFRLILVFCFFLWASFISFRAVRWERCLYVYIKCISTVPHPQKREFAVQILPNLIISLNLLLQKWDLTAHKRALQLYFCACYCEPWKKQIILVFSSVILKWNSYQYRLPVWFWWGFFVGFILVFFFLKPKLRHWK